MTSLMTSRFLFTLFSISLLISCSPSRNIGRSARKNVLDDPALKTAHVGISVFDPHAGKYLYNYQGDKYFVPASNTKIPTCYAAMKFLGDSLVGLRYEKVEGDLLIEGTGDPTFLHPDFKSQKAWDLIADAKGSVTISFSNWDARGWGSGWSWNDYSESYMAERSVMPIYGNVTTFSGSLKELQVQPAYFFRGVNRDSTEEWSGFLTDIRRPLAENKFFLTGGSTTARTLQVPFYTEGGRVVLDLLSERLNKRVKESFSIRPVRYPPFGQVVYTQPTDSMLKPMMHRSDNFFAEQSLLMASNEAFGFMSDSRIIDSLLKTDFADLPQRPRWVDGSGLSRYNLFTPQDFVAILNKMRDQFGMDRLREVMATGNEGTLSGYYKTESGQIFAKTGTLSGVVALSGFLYTKKGRLLIFSVLVNNHQASATAVRRAVEKFVQGLREE
jgi:D-alanyl-D-alanine carboxypeptidase/D-alanyl-D-alanine-endopeptidase (penicillin-binding protein 4)